MNSPVRKANHNPSIPFNEEAEKTANFLPAIDLKSQNTTPRSSLMQASLSHQVAANSQSSIQPTFIYNQIKSVEKNYIHDNSKRNYQSSCQQDILNGIQRISKEPSNPKELALLKESSILHNYGSNRRSIQLNQSCERSGQNLYNNSYGYQITLEKDLRLNQSYEVDISNSARAKQNHYSNSINSSLVQINNQQKYRSQSCQRKPSDQLLLGSMDFNCFNHIYAFTPQSAPNSQIEGTFITRKNINQIKTLSYPHTNIVDQLHISQQSQQRQIKEDNLITSNKIKESTTPNPLSNPFDPLKQETQIHFDTDGCRKKMQDEPQSQSEIKRDNRFPKGFFVQTPTSSKRRTIRLNQNIYQTPVEKKDSQIQSFTNINEYQFTFGDEDSEIQENNLPINIQSSKNSNMYQMSNQSQKIGYQFENNQQEKNKQCGQDDKHKDYLNQQITKNDVCRSVAAKGGISLSANQQRQDENAVIDQVTFGLFPMRDHSSNQNQQQIIHSPLNESPIQTTSAGVRKYQKPKSLLFKKMFEKVNSLIDDQKRADHNQHQENSEIGDSPLHGSERLINNKNYQQRQSMAKVFHSRQSSPKNKQFRQPNGKKMGLASSILQQIKDADNQIQMINYAQSRENQESPLDRESNQQTTSIENSKKNYVENDKNQIYLKFQKKLSFQLNNNQNSNTSNEASKNPQINHLNGQVKNKNSTKSSDQQHQDAVTQVMCQNNDKLNKWLQEHNQYKQSNIVDYQMYVGISCYSVTPNQQLSARASFNQDEEQNKNPNNTFSDKTRLYNNVQIPSNSQQIQITNQSPNNNDTSANNIQIQSAQKIQVQSNKLTLKQKQNTKKYLQASSKLNSASDLDIQNAQIGQSSNCSPKSLKKKAVVRKLSSLQINEEIASPDENIQQKQNQQNQMIDKIIDLQKISQESIQIKNSQNKLEKQLNKNQNIKQIFEKVPLKKDNKSKGENTKMSANKNIGPWINEKDDTDDDIMMERILQNQTQIKIQ
ncbi:hypothetical protein ABPG74_006354 [Tetrahymena malaccensis]